MEQSQGSTGGGPGRHPLLASLQSRGEPGSLGFWSVWGEEGWGSLQLPGKEGEGRERQREVSPPCRKGEAGVPDSSRRQVSGAWFLLPSSEGHLCSLTAACAPSCFPRRTLGPAQHFILSYFEGRRGGLAGVGGGAERLPSLWFPPSPPPPVFPGCHGNRAAYLRLLFCSRQTRETF